MVWPSSRASKPAAVLVGAHVDHHPGADGARNGEGGRNAHRDAEEAAALVVRDLANEEDVARHRVAREVGQGGHLAQQRARRSASGHRQEIVGAGDGDHGHGADADAGLGEHLREQPRRLLERRLVQARAVQHEEVDVDGARDGLGTPAAEEDDLGGIDRRGDLELIGAVGDRDVRARQHEGRRAALGVVGPFRPPRVERGEDRAVAGPGLLVDEDAHGVARPVEGQRPAVEVLLAVDVDLLAEPDDLPGAGGGGRGCGGRAPGRRPVDDAAVRQADAGRRGARGRAHDQRASQCTCEPTATQATDHDDNLLHRRESGSYTPGPRGSIPARASKVAE